MHLAKERKGKGSRGSNLCSQLIFTTYLPVRGSYGWESSGVGSGRNSSSSSSVATAASAAAMEDEYEEQDYDGSGIVNPKGVVAVGNPGEVRAEEIAIVVIVLLLWAGAIALFINR